MSHLMAVRSRNQGCNGGGLSPTFAGKRHVIRASVHGIVTKRRVVRLGRDRPVADYDQPPVLKVAWRHIIAWRDGSESGGQVEAERRPAGEQVAY
eukprot:scaffold92717_cov31-Tisochrysis_lutea.AAC.1